MRAALVPNGTAPVARLAMRDASFFDLAYVQQAVDAAQARCAEVAAGLDELTILERLALQLLCDSAGLLPPAPVICVGRRWPSPNRSQDWLGQLALRCPRITAA